MIKPEKLEHSSRESTPPGQRTSPSSQGSTTNNSTKKSKKSKKKGKKGKHNKNLSSPVHTSVSDDKLPSSIAIGVETPTISDISNLEPKSSENVVETNDSNIKTTNMNSNISIETSEKHNGRNNNQTEMLDTHELRKEKMCDSITINTDPESITSQNNLDKIEGELDNSNDVPKFIEKDISEEPQTISFQSPQETHEKQPQMINKDDKDSIVVESESLMVSDLLKKDQQDPDQPEPDQQVTEKDQDQPEPDQQVTEKDQVQDREQPADEFQEQEKTSEYLQQEHTGELQEQTYEEVHESNESTEELEQLIEEQDAPLITQTQVSSGPYSLIDLIKNVPLKNSDIPESQNAFITCIEAWELNIYIGTSVGEIIHMYKIDDDLGYIQISRQRFSSSKLRPISKILLLPEMAKALIQCGSTVSAYILPELSPANIGKIRDVMDMSIDYNEVQLDANKHNYITPIDHINGDVFVKATIFAKKSIRLIRVFDEGIKLFKDVHYPHSINGVQRSNYAAVGTYTNYDLIDLNEVQKIPLFPLTATPQADESPKQDRMSPYIIPVGNSEFLMTCGSNKTEPAIGMVVNLNGDVSRGTIALDNYPTSLAVDFPYALSVFNDNSLKVYSLHDQSECQYIIFPTNTRMKAKSVSHIFELKDNHLAEKLTKIPMISQLTPEELEKTAIENDVASENASVESSCIIYDELGASVQLMKPQTRIDRLLSIYESASTKDSQFVFDELLDELKQEKGGKKSVVGNFALTLLGLLSLKFYMFDQCFEIWCHNFKYLDPRILIFVVYGEENIHGSVWQFQGLMDIVKSIKDQYSSLDHDQNAEVEDFSKLFLNTVIDVGTFRNDGDDIVKTAELQLLKISLCSDNNLTAILKQIKYSSKEVVETLLLNKKYFHLAKFYEQRRDCKQFLYYWKGLISGEYKDEKFDKKYSIVDKPIRYLINYLVANCTDDSPLIWKYGEWLLTSYPKFGFELLTDKHLQKIDVSDVKILNLLNNEKEIKSKYLEYMLYVKNEKQFMGDLIMADMEKLTDILEYDNIIIGQLDSSHLKYIELNFPKMSVFKFWDLQKNRFENNKFPKLFENIYENISFINKDTISVLGQENIIDTCLRILSTPPFKDRFSLLVLLLHFKKGNYKQVISDLCDIQDFATAELFATTLKLPVSISSKSTSHNKSIQENDSKPDDSQISELLLMQIFDVYLRMNHGYLIESFLNNYNLQDDDTSSSTSVLEKMDKFVGLLERVPDSFPLSQLQGFLTRSIVNFQDDSDELVMRKNLTKSYNANTGRFLKTLQASGIDEEDK